MKFTKSSKRYGKDDFSEVFLIELEKNMIGYDFDDLMENGGWLGDDIEYRVASFTDDESQITVRVMMFYDELTYGGCANIPPRENSRRANFQVRIEKKNGEADIDTAEFEIDDLDEDDRDYLDSEF